MKTKKRVLSALLALSIAVGLAPAAPAFAEEEPALIPAERAGIEGLPSDGTYFTAGNSEAKVDEHGRYILTIYRDGNVSGESSVQLKTVDVSARYGKDYIIDDSRYSTDVTETDGIIMENLSNDDYLKASAEAMKEINEKSEEMQTAAEQQAEEGTAEQTEEESAEENTEEKTAMEKSPLAMMKEAQTGGETRETYESENTDILPELVGAGFDMADEMETSSETTLTFAPDETEKQVMFKILDDNESEGEEMINFILSNPSEGAMVTEPLTTTVIIKDDEPVVHPHISFTDAEYYAENGVAHITVKRSEPLYSYVTAVVRTKSGSAKSGENFKETEGMIEFLPYRDETSFDIPVAAGDDDTEFTVELNDLRGGDEGDIMSAAVYIDGENNSSENGSVRLAAASSKVKIKGVEYTVDFREDSNFGKIYRDESPNDIAGYYKVPNDFKYGLKSGDGDFTTEFEGDAGYLKYYSSLITRHGSAYAEYSYDQQRYQEIFLDMKTNTKAGDSVKMGFSTSVNGSDKEFAVNGSVDQAIRPDSNNEVKLHYKAKEASASQSEEYKPGTGWQTLKVFASRVKNCLYEPEMWFYGAIFINREFHINVEYADQLEYKSGTGTEKKVPGAVTANKTKVYTDSDVTFSKAAVTGEAGIYGELIGYDIQCGTGTGAKTLKLRPERLGKTTANKKKYGTDCYYAGTDILSTDCDTITFTYDLIKEIDKKTGSVSSSGADFGYYTNLYVKPVFEKIPVKVTIVKADNNLGKFIDKSLIKSSTKELYIGDVLDMDAQPVSPEVHYIGYAYEAYVNPGDTAVIDSADLKNYTENPRVTLLYRHYKLKPFFNDMVNHIEIRPDRQVLEYFDIYNTVDGKVTGEAALKGMTLLKTGKNQTDVEPIAGKAYTIELVPKAGKTLPPNLRPRITNAYNVDEYADGYRISFLASASYQKNVFNIDMRKKVGDYKYFSLSGTALYQSVALLDGSSPLTNEPAMQNAVVAGSWLVNATDKKGNEIYKTEFKSAITGNDGKFTIDGIKAVPGDRISVLITNNNIDQIVYLTLNEGGEVKQKTFYELTDPEDNSYTSVTKDCISVAMNTVSMPIRTYYAPYIRNVTLKYADKPLTNTTNTMEIVEGDSIVATAYVTANKTNVQRVEFLLFNKKGDFKGTNYDPVYDENLNVGTTDPSQEENAPAYIYRSGKPDSTTGICTASIPADDIVDGDKLYVRIISGEKNGENNNYLTYPVLNVGVTFFTPIKDIPRQTMNGGVSGDDLGSLPLLGDLASNLDSGGIIWKTTYADPTQAATSAYIRTLGIGMDVAQLKKAAGEDGKWSLPGKSDLDALRKGTKSEAKKSNEEKVDELMQNFDPDAAQGNMQGELASVYDKKISQKEEKLGRSLSNDEKTSLAKKLYEQEAYKNNLNEMNEDWKLTFSVRVMMQFLFVYDVEKKEHVFYGAEYLVAGTVTVKKITYWVIYGIPVFLNFQGSVSVQLDGTYQNYTAEDIKNGAVKISAKEVDEMENLLNKRFKNKEDIPWVQLGLSVKIQPGVGYCGVLDVHGTLKLSLLGRFTFTSEQTGDNKSGGFMVDFSGGIGASLVIVNLEFQLGRIKQGWGVFDTNGPVTEGPKLLSAEDNEKQGYTYLAPFDIGEGEYEPETGGISLQSVLRPVGEPKTIVGKTMEVTSPAAVRINDRGDIFMAYLSNNGKGDAANAAALKYKIRHADGTYTDAAEVQPGNEVEDAQPSVLYKDGKVYIAWVSADEKLAGIASAVSKDGTLDNVQEVDSENLAATKDNLKKLNIYLAEYDIESGAMSEPKKIAEDSFENTNVKLTEENGKIAVYYFKRYIDGISKTDELLSLTSNYNTWAKQMYDPDKGKFESLGKYAADDAISGHKMGDDITEKLISIKHPTLTDPLVYDLSAETYIYTDPVDSERRTEYSFYAYTIDTDKDLQTSGDREVWLEITNVTDNKTYYPVRLDKGVTGSNEKAVSSPQLTEENGDVLITWLYDSSYFKMIGVKDTLDTLRTESANQTAQNTQVAYNDSPLSVFRAVTAEEAQAQDWYITAADKASAKLGDNEGLTKNIAEGKLPIITKNFSNGAENEGSRQEADMSDYRLVVGDDNNVYLFWTQSSDNYDKLGRVLYASAYFRINDEWLAKYGDEATNAVGFSDAVVINDTDLVIDEMSAVVAQDSSAVIFANTCRQKFEKSEDGSKNPIVLDGDRNLVEFAFRPVNSLEVVDDEITLSDQYPVPGEAVDISFTVKNTGLLPTEGDTIKLELLQGDKVIKEEEISESGNGNMYYVGEEHTYVTDTPWTIPDSLDDLSIKVTINEDDVEGTDITVNKINQTAFVEHQEPTVVTYDELFQKILERVDQILGEKYEDFNAFEIKDLSSNLEEWSEEQATDFFTKFADILITASDVIDEEYPEFKFFAEQAKQDAQNADSIDDIDITNAGDMYDYIVYLPVRNTGNVDANVTAEINYVNDVFEQTEEIMGRTGEVMVLSHVDEDSDEISYIAIPINVKPEQFSENGVVQGNIKLMNGDDIVDEYTRFVIFETKNVDFSLDSADSVTLKKGETSQLETTAIPYNSVKRMSYSSSDTNVAMVDDEGVITAIGAGTAQITVTELDSGKAKYVNVTVTDTEKKSSGGGGGGSSTYKVSVDKKYNSSSSNGTISVSKGTANAGDTITVTVTPDEGYEVKDVIVKDKDGNVIEVTKNADGTYSFTQPKSAVTVDAEFTEIGSNPSGGDTEDWWFKDVPETTWYFAPIKEAYDAERMSGMSADFFEPETDITRGMFAYAIYRREGLPETDAANKFEDVKEGSYYETAIAWATENEIVAGYDDTHYGPDDAITREQLAAILWRYAKYKEKDVSAGEDTNILSYTDAQDISEYAIPAIQWAVGESIITGFEDDTLRAKENANRAQMAVILNKISDYFNN